MRARARSPCQLRRTLCPSPATVPWKQHCREALVSGGAAGPASKGRVCLHRWKLVHGDVFRAPRGLELLAALVGTGVQLALLVLSVILITIAGCAHSDCPESVHFQHRLLLFRMNAIKLPQNAQHTSPSPAAASWGHHSSACWACAQARCSRSGGPS